MRPAPLLLAAALLASGAVPSAGQRPTMTRPFAADSVRRPLPAAIAGLLSAAVPGAGEYALRLDRWIPRLAIEGFAWWQFREHRQEARQFERQYRLLACQVARRIAPGQCQDAADFEYYEQLGKWSSSGSFDSNPTIVGLQPEADSSTYNGDVWKLAQRRSTSTAGALAYYEAHAIAPAYVWNWGDNTLEQTVYREVIRRGDDAFRSSSRILGIILANHATSAVDAFIAARLRELAAGRAVHVHTGVAPAGARLRWAAEVRLGIGER